MNKKYSLSSDYIRYLDSMIKENDKRQLNNKEVVDTLNNQNKTLKMLFDELFLMLILTVLFIFFLCLFQYYR